MIFSSFQYLLFLPVAVFLYWRSRGHWRTLVVVLTSYFFYMSWMPVYGLLLFAITLFNWLLGLSLGQAKASQNQIACKLLLLLGLFANVGALCYYKYANFALQNLTKLARTAGGALPQSDYQAWLTQCNLPFLEIILPLGISFFVFEFVHYLVDVYKGDKAATNFLDFAAFAAFFPSQIAGPIKRYQDFLVKLADPERLSRPVFYEGISLIMQGLFKKVALADNIATIIAAPYASSVPVSFVDGWLATIGFTIQIYCDFSGYTDMGRGSALLLGIRLPENFNLPLIAPNLTLFWRRWHISLSSWLRDYIYIPLGGSRGAKWLNYRNLFLTMAIGGLWHGASWHYVVWGVAHGLGLIAHRLWCALLDKTGINQAISASKSITVVTTVVSALITFVFVAVAFSIFRAPDTSHAIVILQSLINVRNQDFTMLVPLLKSGIVPVSFAYMTFWLLSDYLLKHRTVIDPLIKSDNLVQFKQPVRLASWIAACILMVASRPMETVPFLYFQF